MISVIFDSNGGSSIPLQCVPKGSRVPVPIPPFKQGCSFVAWFSDKKCSCKWDFETVVERSVIVLYAGWAECGRQGIFDSICRSKKESETSVIGSKAYVLLPIGFATKLMVESETNAEFPNIVLYEDGSHGTVWSFFNLLLVVVAVLLALYFTVAIVKKYSGSSKGAEQKIKWYAVILGHVAVYICCVVVALMFVMTTPKITLLPSVFNSWSVLIALFVIVEIGMVRIQSSSGLWNKKEENRE